MIKDNLSHIKAELPDGVQLVAVSKFHPVERIMEAYRQGQRVFGENRPQEMAAKAAAMPKDIEWHQIGHLQTNKVRMIVPFVKMIESVDSLRLAQEISRQAERIGRCVDVLLELHVAREESKHGWSEEELMDALKAGELQSLTGIRIVGVMGMATFTDDERVVRADFMRVREIFERLRRDYLPQIEVVSMGMSGDYRLAIECGSNMVRIGSSIFGGRS